MVDLAAVVSCWILAYFLRFYAGLPVPYGVPDSISYLKLTPFVILIWSAVFMGGGLYRNNRICLKKRQLGHLLKLCTLAMLAFLAASSFYHEFRYSRLTFIFFMCLHPIAIYWMRRVLFRMSFYHDGGGVCVGVVCHPERLQEVLAQIREYFELRPKVQVFLYPPSEGAPVKDPFLTTLEFVQSPEQFDRDFFISHPFEFLWVALKSDTASLQQQLLAYAADQVTNITLVPDLGAFNRFGYHFNAIAGQPVIQFNHSPLEGYLAPLKRVMDIMGALCALLLFSPCMLLIALGVKLSSPGPIFYRQTRMGMDGQTFEMLKFRSMRVDSEKASGAVWAQKGDTRTTLLGGFIRKFSLDELPQLFNVFWGDMSLVGPRPERPVFVRQFREQIPGYMLRHKVRSGMTGLAQVKGWRGNTSLEKRIDCDLYYIRCWSPWLDIKILLLTVIRGFYHPNAY